MGGGKYVCHVFAEYKVSTIGCDTKYLESASRFWKSPISLSELCCLCFSLKLAFIICIGTEFLSVVLIAFNL